ncbi:hypothetical protein [Pandoraea oxalativorans]|nr:hypothetical protein [Pandoraea oxalativorans]
MTEIHQVRTTSPDGDGELRIIRRPQRSTSAFDARAAAFADTGPEPAGQS